MVARSRAALPHGKPVLWSIDWEAGHNVGADYAQLDTDLFAFSVLATRTSAIPADGEEIAAGFAEFRQHVIPDQCAD